MACNSLTSIHNTYTLLKLGFSGNKRLYGLFRIVSKTPEGITYENKQLRRGFETSLGGYKTGFRDRWK